MARLDSEHLRTFLAIAEAGSVTGGADRINRSQSAASLQMRLLEDIVGTPLFHRHGRGVTLTQAGDRLLPVARRVTQSLDATLAELRGDGLTGRLRIGLPDDHSRSALATIVADFAARHPDVELEVQCALGAGFGAAIKAGALDLAIHEVPEPGAGDEVLREDELVWMGRRDRDFGAGEPLPVAVFDRDCWWRDAALSGLESAGRSYRVVFTSESGIGVRAAVHAGIAAGLLNASVRDDTLAPVLNLPLRYASYLVLQTGRGVNGAAVTAMRNAIRAVFRRTCRA